MALAGLLICYQDYKHKFVKNKYILVLLSFGLIFQFLRGNLLSNFPLIIGIFTLGATLSFFLWFLGILPAADSKLFTSLLLYFPISYYSRELPLNFLVNVFVPVFVFMTAHLLFKSDKKTIKESLKHSFSIYKIGMIFVIFIGFMWFIYSPLKTMGLDLGYLGMIVLLFIGYELLFRFSSGKTEIIFIVLAVLRVIIDYKNILALEFFINSLIIVGIFLILRFFILKISVLTFSESTKIKNLREGMILGEGIRKSNGEYEKEKIFNTSLIGYLINKKRKYIHPLSALSRKDVERIKKLYDRGNFSFDTVKVHRTQHFSTFVFTGYFLTFIFGTNLPEFIRLFI